MPALCALSVSSGAARYSIGEAKEPWWWVGQQQVVGRVAAHAPARRPRQRLRVAAQLDPGEAWLHESLAARRQKKSGQLEPSFSLDAEGAVTLQLKALQHNNFPMQDSGLEGRTQAGRAALAPDIVALTLSPAALPPSPYYVTLVNHTSYEVLSKLEIDEGLWKARVEVENSYRRERRVYEFTMERRFGGRFDGFWYCSSLIAEGVNNKTLYGII
eukprot:scaffold5.g876.t1